MSTGLWAEQAEPAGIRKGDTLKVFVLNMRGKPLMPCSPAKARHMLKTGKPVFIPRGYFGLGTEFFYEVKAAKGCKVTKRTEYKVKDFDDIAWAYLNIPAWWGRKEDKE